MGMMYFLSLLVLAVSFILIKKSNKQLNILGFINITIGTLFCYNTLVSYALTFKSLAAITFEPSLIVTAPFEAVILMF